jgi:diadenosine tetraphosphate (Ap4A) HIT family hydrolase
MTNCYICDVTAEGDASPSWQRIYVDEHWRVAHAYDSALLGWLVVVARRHIESLAEMTEQEALALGPLLRALSIALQEFTGATKAYVMFLAENTLHRHVHMHVIPRMPDLPDELRGPGIFHYLSAPDREIVSEEQRSELAVRLRTRL